MADLSITNLDPDRTDRVRYALGQPNWDPFRIPDISDDGNIISLTEDQVIDIIILADGYDDQAEFEDQLSDWLQNFFDVTAYEKFSGAFRIRALFVTSDEPCSSSRDSFYRVRIQTGDREEVDHGDWYKDGGTDNERFRDRLFAAIEEFEFNATLYPDDLDASGIHNSLANLYSNLVIMMLVRTASDQNISGRTVAVPDGRRRVNVGLGALSIHEFGHAFAYLQDEYISKRKTEADKTNPGRKSVFTLCNLTYSDLLKDAFWLHLSPWGSLPRQAAGNDPSPVVGWLWRGGEDDLKVWHSEYHCLMNGTHENYAFTFDDDNDPTSEGNFANLRFRNPPRYCLWCQEIVVIRILEKTQQLAADDDPSDINKRGEIWYKKWVNEWRDYYWEFFNVPGQIRDREELYADPSLEPGSFEAIKNADGTFLDIWRSDLYKPFMSSPANAGTPPGFDETEQTILMNAFD